MEPKTTAQGVQAKESATDCPVLPPHWHALRQWEQARWWLVEFSPGTSNIVSFQDCIVDDLGNMVALDAGQRDANSEFWWSTYCIDQGACDWADAQAARDDAHMADLRARQRTADLLRPPTITVELVTEPPDAWCVASVVVSADPRLDVPMYSLHVGAESPVLLTLPQLAAIGLAAEQLLAQASEAAAPHGAQVH